VRAWEVNFGSVLSRSSFAWARSVATFSAVVPLLGALGSAARVGTAPAALIAAANRPE
jgi:hypothetical protein